MKKSKSVKCIPLTRGKFAVVDADDYEWLSQWKWNCLTIGYASRTEYLGTLSGKQKKRMILMHRLIMNTPKGMETDHINHDKLDNRKCNLRICTMNDNKKNMAHRKNSKKKTSKYKGVYWDKRDKKWIAKIMVNRKRVGLGYFDCEEDAARMYDIAAKKLHGSFATINNIAL